MNILEQLLGGNQQQQDYQGFVQRYQQGPPSEGFSDQEAVDRYNQVAAQLPPQQYMQAAQAAFANMPPDHRSQLGQFLAQAGQQYGLPVGGDGAGNYQDPTYLAQMATQMHQQQPGMLSQLLGDALGGGSGGTGGMLGSILGGGDTGGQGGMLSNPIAKAALGGIAAMAMRQVMGQRQL